MHSQGEEERVNCGFSVIASLVLASRYALELKIENGKLKIIFSFPKLPKLPKVFKGNRGNRGDKGDRGFKDPKDPKAIKKIGCRLCRLSVDKIRYE